MRHLIFPVLLLAAQPAFADTSSPSAGWRPYLDLQAWEASDAVAVKKFDSDWSSGFSPKEGRNVSLQRLRGGIGMEKDGWSIGWEARQEAILVADRETLELVRLYKQRIDPVAGSTFNVHARFDKWSAQGLRIAHAFDGPVVAGHAPRLRISAAFYTKPQLRENEVAGSASYRQAGAYGFNAAQTDAYSRYRYPFMAGDPSASGASLSASMNWPLAQTLSFRLKSDDLWSRIRWSSLPVMQRTANSEVTDRDSNGYINYGPVLRGRNQQIDKSFSIPRSTSASLSYRQNQWGGAAQVERWAGVTIPTLSVTRYFGWGNLTTSIETRFNSAALGIEMGKLHVSVQSDSLHPDRAKALGLQIRYCMVGE